MTIEQTIDSADVAALREVFSGVVLTPRDPSYDEARKVWNAMIDRRPAVILRCADTADVQRAVRFARAHDLLTSVRGGGHSIAGLAVCDGGVMLDLSLMRGVDVDPTTRRAVVQGGATWSDFDGASQQRGLATTGGHVGSTGVGGLTLGGGFGWLHGKHGLASDNLLSAELVTAEGDVVRASEDENPELFWGLRGGGGNFGVVTSFEFALHPLTDVFVGGVMYPRDKGADLMEVYDDLVDKLPYEATSAFTLGTVPEGLALVPPEFQGVESSGAFVIYPGATQEEGERLIEPLRAFGPSFELMQPMPYLGLQTLMDATWQMGKSVYWKSGRIDTLGRGAAAAIVEAASDAYACMLIQLGGAIAERSQAATAFAHRDARYQFLTSAMWDDPSETEAQVARARKAWQTVEPHTSGAFVNFVTTDDWDKRTNDAYGAEHRRRLAAIKKTYDPDNFFRMNANITPA
jgi:FAD/FMN-containing dehydrogenase